MSHEIHLKCGKGSGWISSKDHDLCHWEVRKVADNHFSLKHLLSIYQSLSLGCIICPSKFINLGIWTYDVWCKAHLPLMAGSNVHVIWMSWVGNKGIRKKSFGFCFWVAWNFSLVTFKKSQQMPIPNRGVAIHFHKFLKHFDLFHFSQNEPLTSFSHQTQLMNTSTTC